MINELERGRKANKNGKILEDILIPLFKNHGYFYINEKSENKKYLYSKQDMEDLKNQKDKYFIKNAEYISIYGHKSRTEFLVVNKMLKRKFRIECKWQQSNGSVDEKLPYLYLNCVFAFEEDEIILIIDGKGQKEGAINWIKKANDSNWLNKDGKTIRIMNISEFINWFNNFNSIYNYK